MALLLVSGRSNSQTKVNRFTESKLPLLISSCCCSLSHKRHFPCKVLQRKMEDFLPKRQSRSLCLPSTGSSESGSKSANVFLKLAVEPAANHARQAQRTRPQQHQRRGLRSCRRRGRSRQRS